MRRGSRLFIGQGGPTNDRWPPRGDRLHEQRLVELGEVEFQRIEVRPFSVERFGTQFGLVATEVNDDPGVWTVELLPGNYMAFFAPWNSGDYDT